MFCVIKCIQCRYKAFLNVTLNTFVVVAQESWHSLISRAGVSTGAGAAPWLLPAVPRRGRRDQEKLCLVIFLPRRALHIDTFPRTNNPPSDIILVFIMGLAENNECG